MQTSAPTNRPSRTERGCCAPRAERSRLDGFAGFPPRIVQRHLVLLFGLLLAGLTVGTGTAGAAEFSAAQVRAMLADMAALRAEFDPQGLHRLGLPGLRAVLDELLPETAQLPELTVPFAEVRALIEQLGDPRYAARVAAEQQLLELGPCVAPLLHEATASEDAELRWRAARLLRFWQQQRAADKAQYAAGFAVYAAGIQDAERFEELARRVPAALAGGLPPPGKQQILRECIKALASRGDPRHVEPLRPLIDHPELRVATLVVAGVGSAADGAGPAVLPLLGEALKAQRDEVAAAALTQIARIVRTAPKPELRELLIPVFDQRPEPLKFQAAMVLLSCFDYLPAREYFLDEVRSGDRTRQLRALNALGNVQRQAADEALLETLVPLLSETDFNLRRMVAVALAAYDGEQVARSLVPLLGDPQSAIASEVGRRLVSQSDEQMLRRVLQEAASGDNPRVRQAALDLLKKLD